MSVLFRDVINRLASNLCFERTDQKARTIVIALTETIFNYPLNSLNPKELKF